MPIKVIKDTAIDLGKCDFLEPYVRRALDVAEGDEPLTPVAAVRIVTDESEGEPDAEFEAFCDENPLPVAVLRCPYIVGTGMNGLMMRMAAGIYNGRFVHIKGNDARISVVHAVDVAAAVALASGIQGTYTLTDTTDPSIYALAEAFAYRLGDRRIITIKPRWARLWYGRSYYETLTESHTAVCTFTELFPELHPVAVTDYLRTHVYDEKSL